MTCFGDAAGRLQETGNMHPLIKGNRYINSCLRYLSKHLGRNLDVLDTAVNKLLRPP
ncbi:unnamed protein product [Brassica oleracea var. botrytis]